MNPRTCRARHTLTGFACLLAASFVQAQDAAQTLDAVKVDGSRVSDVGGMRVDTVGAGPLGDLSRVDTPYTVTAVPQRIIESQQLRSIADALRLIPSVQGDGVRPQSRGIQGSVVQNSRLDGLNAVSTTDYPLEQFDRIEVMNGPAGSLYGPSNPAGNFNYVLKRPTESPRAAFDIGYASQGRRLAEADLSGPIGGFGYRVILLNEHGENTADDSRLRRQLASLALDYRFSPDTVLSSNFSHYRYVSKGLPATFALAAGVRFPSVPDPTTSSLGERDGGNDNTTDTGSLEFTHAFSDRWRLRAGLLRQIADRESTGPTNTLIDDAGDYRTTISTSAASRFTITSDLLYLNGGFATGAVEHAVTVGTSGFQWNNYNPRAGATATLGSATLADPRSFPLIGVPDFTERYQSAAAKQQAFNVADNVSFDDQWSALLVANKAWLSTDNYNAAGLRTSTSSDEGVSRSGSVTFKPRQDMSTYVSYADNLQQGDTAPAGSLNAGTILAPFRSRQWELGYKAALPGMNLAIAAFQIKRPFAYTEADGTFGVAGMQRNRGVELSADGDISPEVSLFGGVALLDPRLLDTGDATTSGRRIVGLARATANLLAQYHPAFVPGGFASANVHYVSSRATDNANLYSVGSYATVDLGLGYETTWSGHATVYRFTVDNVTDRRFWTNIVPGGLNGYSGAGNATASIGAPRSVLASMELRL